ncbi:Non-structural maintenance of chromosomes element 1 homolog [Sergentomyia squamirostris]
MSDWTSLHRAIIQLMIGRGSLQVSEFTEIFQGLKTLYSDQEGVPSATEEIVVEKINENLEKFSLSIVRTKYEYTDEEFYVFVARIQSPEAKFQNLYTEAEIQFFPLLLKEIITSDDLCISPIQALNLIPKLQKPVTKTRAGEILKAWITAGYFQNIDEMLHLGPRTLVEFNGYLTVQYSDYVKTCVICKNTVYKVLSCKSSSCSASAHGHCLDRYHENFPNICPECKEEWA